MVKHGLSCLIYENWNAMETNYGFFCREAAFVFSIKDTDTTSRLISITLANYYFKYHHGALTSLLTC